MKRICIILVMITFVNSLFSQQAGETQSFGIRFGGFVKNDFIFDSRQTVALREGHFLLWPQPQQPDPDGVDINRDFNFNFLAVQTRLTGSITGPDAFGAKTSGMIEGAFFGHSDPDVNGFRLRHAYGKLMWTNTELLFGQYWHPMFITACFPDVVSFNTGAPFQPFSRNPQVRLTHRAGSLSLMIAAFSQRDFTSSGGSSQLRDSGIPEIHGQVSYSEKNAETGKEFLAGFGAGYKTLVPRLKTNLNYAADEKVGSFITEAFLKIRLPAITWKAEGVYGQNTYDVVGISSFAVTSVNIATDEREYAPLSSMSAWTEVHTNGQNVSFGLFAGYTKNLGTKETILPSITQGTRSNIDYIYRVSPRVVFNSGKVRLACELEYTAAAFGTLNNEGRVDNAIEAGNVRFLIGAYYFF